VHKKQVVLRIDNNTNIMYIYGRDYRERKKMKIGISLVILVCVTAIIGLGLGTVYAEIIYTKDGRQIQAKVTEKTEDTIWYEIVSGDIIEEIGIDITEVEKVLNDDGSISEYSPKR